jgi:hypothetical protein
MAEMNPVFVGVDIDHAAGRLRRAYVYAALDADRELLAIGTGDRNEVLAYLGGQQAAHVAINAPRQPNRGVINQQTNHQGRLPLETPGNDENSRLCEVLLQQQGFNITATPNKAKDCPRWMQHGFDLYRRLESFGYLPFPNSETLRQTLETHPDAIFWRLLSEKPPLPESLEGRLQRQLILRDIDMPVKDAMDFFLEITRHKLMQGEIPDQDIHPLNELNALAAAHIAWQAALEPDTIELIGDSDEGQIALPVYPASRL